MTPHMLTERQLIRGVNAACYFRVFMLRNLVFSLPCNVDTQSHVLPCPQFVLYSDDGTITLSYRGRVSNVSCFCPELSIKTSGKKKKVKLFLIFSLVFRVVEIKWIYHCDSSIGLEYSSI